MTDVPAVSAQPQQGAVRTPAELARETLVQLSQRRLLPTPENYGRIYAELSGVQVADTNAWLRQLCVAVGRMPGAATLGPLERALETDNHELVRAAVVNLCEMRKSDAPSADWGRLIRLLMRHTEADQPGWPVPRKRQAIEHVLRNYGHEPHRLANRLSGLVYSWTDTGRRREDEAIREEAERAAPAPATPAVAAAPAAPVVPAAPAEPVAPAAPAPQAAAASAAPVARASAPAKPAEALRGATSDAVESYVLLRNLGVELLRYAVGDGDDSNRALSERMKGMIEALGAASTLAEFTRLAPQVRELIRDVALARASHRDRHDALVSLLHLIVSNIEELVPERRWIAGEVERLRSLIADSADPNAFAEAEAAFRSVIIRQSQVRSNLEEAKVALRNMLTTFAGRLGDVTASTGNFGSRIQAYADKFEQTEDLTKLPELMSGLLEETRTMQIDLARAHKDMVEARERAAATEATMARLEQELANASHLMHHDELTELLNRRGLNEAYAHETSRCDRQNSPVSLSVIDIDNFKALNDTHGHAAGDRAIRAFGRTVAEALRREDFAARFGGDEFCVLFTHVGAAEARVCLLRVLEQVRQLALDLPDGTRLGGFTASMGLAELLPAHTHPDDLLQAADQALYRAKACGRDRLTVS